jgi:segregation and condensation protein B
LNDNEFFKVDELSDSLGIDVDVTGEVSPVFDESHARRVIEAVLFAAGHPVTFAKLAEVLSTTVANVRRVVQSFAEEYNSPDSPVERGIMMLVFDDSCQLASREAYGDHIRTALGIKRGGNLSPSSLEVLAIIAYNEPVTRVYVDTVRGVDSGYAVNSLAERQLIEPCGRLDAPGRPILYRTTANFLRVFGLNSLTDLPAVKAAETDHTDETIPLEGLEDLAVGSTGTDEDEDETNDEARNEAQSESDAAPENGEEYGFEDDDFLPDDLSGAPEESPGSP